jgi:hypothetical protein
VNVASCVAFPHPAEAEGGEGGCTAPSLIPTLNGNTASLRTDISPQRKEAQPLSHSDIRLI